MSSSLSANTRSRIAQREDAFLFLVVVGLIVLFSLLTPSGTFLTYNNFKNIALDTAEILILAAGETFLIISAGLDLSVGSLVVFCSVVAAKVIVGVAGTAEQAANFQYPHLARAIVAGIVVTLLAGAAWGFFNGSVSVRLKIPAFIVTLGTLGMAAGLAQVMTGGLNVPNVPPQLQQAFGAGAMFGAIPWLVVVAVVVVSILGVVLAKTRYGLRTYAIGSNQEAARRAGIRVDRHVISLYVLMGLLTGVVGFLDVARFDTASIFAHTQDNLAAISAVVIGGVSLFGGRGRMTGTVLGCFIPTILRNGFILMNVQPYWQTFAIGAVLVIAVYIDQVRRRRVPMA